MAGAGPLPAGPGPLPAGPGPLPAGPGGWPRDLELVRRTDGQRRFFMLINHGDTAAVVRLAGRVMTVPAGDVQVITGESDSGDQRRC
jgi:hypothetical protein